MADAIKEAVKDIKFYLDRIGELEKRNKELEAALRKWLQYNDTDDGGIRAMIDYHYALEATRVALGEKKDDASA